MGTQRSNLQINNLAFESNLQWQKSAITKAKRSSLMGHRPCCVWMTGLSGAGKTTLANLLDETLHNNGKHSFVLDGDRCRSGLCCDLDFSAEARAENVRRIAEVAKLLVEAGLIVIVALISPFAAQRRLARSLFDPTEFVEVFVDTPLSACERRDAKGLYRRARRGEIANFTGISSAYERPENAELILDGQADPKDLLDKLLRCF